MGAQETVVDSLHVFIAIFAHKGLAAYALGSSVVDSGASQRRFWTIVAAFTLATPLGILLGRVVAGESDGNVAAGLSALASGLAPLQPDARPIPIVLLHCHASGCRLAVVYTSVVCQHRHTVLRHH